MTSVLVLAIVGPLVMVAVVLVLVFAAIRRAIDQAAAALATEGIELDSGPVTATTRFRAFSGPGIARAGGIRRNPARVVLTACRLHIVQRPQRYGIIDRGDLHRFTVANLDGKLQVASSDPPGATGSVDYRISVRDPERWISALTAAGAASAAR